MRITNAMMTSSFLNNLNKSNYKMNKLQNQISSNKNFARASEDPIAASKAMELRSNLTKVKQYQNNVTETQDWISQTETSLNEMNSLLGRAYELANSASTGTNGENERQAIANEIDQITQQVVVCSNTSFAGRYVFGGANTTEKPFEVKNVAGNNVLFYNGQNVNTLNDAGNEMILDGLKSEKINYEIGFGATMDVSSNGIDLMGSGTNNLYSVLDKFKQALINGDGMEIQHSISNIQDQQNNIRTLTSEVGAKTNRLEFFQSRLVNDFDNYDAMLTNTEGIDIEKLVMQLKMQESVYEAALQSGSKIIQPTLSDFLR